MDKIELLVACITSMLFVASGGFFLREATEEKDLAGKLTTLGVAMLLVLGAAVCLVVAIGES